MIKVFTTNANNKIELTKEELEALLKESYNEGKSSFSKNSDDSSIWRVDYPEIKPIQTQTERTEKLYFGDGSEYTPCITRPNAITKTTDAIKAHLFKPGISDSDRAFEPSDISDSTKAFEISDITLNSSKAVI